MYVDNPPFLLLKKEGFGSRRLPGKIISISDTGIQFHPLGSPYKKPAFYSIDNIQCLIDSENTVIFGDWGSNSVLFEKMVMICRRVSPTPSDYFFIILKPNQTVSYCAESGEYTVSYLAFGNIITKDIDLSDSLINCNFIVKPNMTNYLGSIYLQYKYKPLSNMTIVPCSFVCQPRIYSRGIGTFDGTALSMPIGGATVSLPIEDFIRFGYGSDLLESSKRNKITEEAKLNDPKHALHLTRDSLFVPVNKKNLPIYHCPFSFHW
jgi:hypothetical protein